MRQSNMTMPRTLDAAVVAAVAVAMLASGCSASEGNAAPEPEETAASTSAVAPDVMEAPGHNQDPAQAGRSAGGVTVLVSERTPYAMDALGGGRLEILGGCLGASGSVIVWPYGTEVVKNEPLTIDIPTYGTFALGDRVRIGGGYVLEHSSHDVERGEYQAGGVTVPADCAKHDIFLAS